MNMKRTKSQTDKIVLRDAKEVEEFLTHLEKAWEFVTSRGVDSYSFLIGLCVAAQGDRRFLPLADPTVERRVLLKTDLSGSTPVRVREDILRLLGEFLWGALFLPPEALWKGVRRTLLLPRRPILFFRWKMRRALGEGYDRRLKAESLPSKLPFLQIYKARPLRASAPSKALRGFVLSVGLTGSPTQIHLRYKVDFRGNG